MRVVAGIGVVAIVLGGGAGRAAIGPQAISRAPHVRNGELAVIDGNGIVVVSNRGSRKDLFRCQEAPGPRFCTAIEGIDWSPTGDKLLFSSTTISAPSPFNGMHVLDLSSGQTRAAGSEGFAPDWSRDGRIALVEPASFPRPVGSIYIRRIDKPTATQEALTTESAGNDSSPSWSPDGKRLVFATHLNGQSAISIINADGSHRRLLTERATSPSWAPDGGVIAYRTRCGVKLITPSGTDVTPGQGNACGRLAIRGVPHWSPDGRKLAIATPNRIYVMDRDGRRRSFIVLNSFSHPIRSLFDRVAPVSWQPIP